MTVLVDLGCFEHGSDFSSLHELITRFRPTIAYGFDVLTDDRDTVIAGVPATIKRAAASTCDGTVRYRPNGTCTSIEADGVEVPAFDFSRWLYKHGPAIVKMDIEGHEYPILEKMRADGTDLLVSLLVVEWHGEPLEDLRCDTMPWWN